MKPKHLLPSLCILISLSSAFAQNENAFASIGKEGKILTLTNGSYDERFAQDSLQRVGSVLINTHTMKVVKLLTDEESWNGLQGGKHSRFLSVDPLQAKYPFSSPYAFVLNNPIINVDIDGREVFWFQALTSSKAFSAVIKCLNKSDVFRTVIKRFQENQDNLFFQTYNEVASGITPNRGMKPDNVTPNGLKGYSVYLSSVSLIANNGDLLVDPTYAAKTVLHEAMHAKYRLIRDNNELNGSPTLKNKMGFSDDGEHETMGEGNIQRLVKGMQEFDASNNTKHSAEWYESMAWRGSLMYNNGGTIDNNTGGTEAYKKLDQAKRNRLEEISKNEYAYETYLLRQSEYKTSNTQKNKNAVKEAKSQVNWKLFKKTRNG